ncbi:hypothetical protein [Labrenzia sp. PHM005]|uniref:hypothetical protein n=1 Tax=Labrenzia sp. PHM005 TaxID=2590016 RepID=UPI00113FE0D5|nr:hypothetical protein [Labrenzia sp. PHM005]QDG74390.1 hypothetical protein FJ695_00045 [Labrenzia sp. PHM005]
MDAITKTDDPTEGQTLQKIEAYLRGVQADDEVVIRNTHGGILTFEIAKVTGTKPSSGRLYTDLSGGYGGCAWYMKSGKNTYYPGGQSQLFIPTDAIREFMNEHPTGMWTYKTYSPE